METAQVTDRFKTIKNRFNKLSDRSIWFETKNSLRAIHWTYALRFLLNSFGLKHIEERLDLKKQRMLLITEADAGEELVSRKSKSSQVDSRVALKKAQRDRLHGSRTKAGKNDETGARYRETQAGDVHCKAVAQKQGRYGEE